MIRSGTFAHCSGVVGFHVRTNTSAAACTSGGAAQGCLTAIISFVGPLLLVLPVGVAAALTADSPVWRWVVFVLSTAYGAVLLAAGVVLGGRRLDRRAPEMLGQLAHAQI